jgi:hypothetical protein
LTFILIPSNATLGVFLVDPCVSHRSTRHFWGCLLL